jgi:hypothetical protein
MTRYEWVTIVAIVMGPILALWVQRILDRLREKSNQRLRLFLALMATRATPLASNHVNALNAIDSVFHRRREKKIREAWAKALEYANHANANTPGWLDRLNDLKADLYQAMGKAVGYTYSIDYLKRHAYVPRHFIDTDLANATIRQTLAQIITPQGIKIVPGVQPPMPPGR